MSHFALVENGFVTNVIVAEQDYIDLLPNKAGWVKTSYNTRFNQHLGADGLPDAGAPLRGNFAGVGYVYDTVNDVFYPPMPHPGAVLDTERWSWSGANVVGA